MAFDGGDGLLHQFGVAAGEAVPADADIGQNLIPWINDPQAVNPQNVCPGYTASDVVSTDSGLTANLNLAGKACNVYGNDVDSLTLKVEYQAADRLHIEIQPRYIGAENESWFLLPEVLVPKPSVSKDCSSGSSDFEVSWTNDPGLDRGWIGEVAQFDVGHHDGM